MSYSQSITREHPSCLLFIIVVYFGLEPSGLIRKILKNIIPQNNKPQLIEPK